MKDKRTTSARVAVAALLAALTVVGCGKAPEPPPAANRFVITNARVADGTGAELQSLNVRIEGERIAKVGRFEPEAGERVIDASGLVLAPGFIDIHNHSTKGLATEPLAPTQIAQGITTLAVGADGDSPWPIGAWLDERRKAPAALNVAALIGHATVRKEVLGDNYRREATPAEQAKMAQLVEQAMQEGAFGLSTGVEYEIASYSNTEELVEVAKAGARHGGFYMSHVRDEADNAFEALEEEIEIGRRAGIALQHSHIKLASVSVWNKAQEFIRSIEAARAAGLDFLADCYPYDAWSSTIKVIVPDKQYEDPESVEQALADLGGADRITITRFPPNTAYEMRSLDALAREAGISTTEMYIKVIREGNAAGEDAVVVGQSMTEADLQAFYKQPWVMVSSDGGIGMRHPRGAGTFPRVLGRYVRELGWLTLPEAVRKMTSLPAQRLGLNDRGVIREGAFADLVLFDPDTVLDHATFAQPHELPVGIEKVFVSGVPVWSEGEPTGERPGRVLTKSHE